MKEIDITGLEVFKMNKASITFVRGNKFYYATRRVANKILQCLRQKDHTTPFYEEWDCDSDLVWLMTPSRF